MLLLRWTYFAQAVPDAEVVSLAAYADDFPDDELEDDLQLGRQPVEDDFIAIAAFDDVVDEDADNADAGIALPEADDYLAPLLFDDGDDDADDQSSEAIALPEADDFLQALRFDDDAEDETDDGEVAFSFDWTLFDVTEILLTALDDVADDETDDPLYLEFDFSPLAPLTDINEIIANPIEYSEGDEDDTIDESTEPWLFFPYPVLIGTKVEWLIRARRRHKR